MIKVNDVLNILNEYAPFIYQEEYDNSGFQIGNRAHEVQKILLCLDLTMDVVEEAIQHGFDLIISHHPLFFKAIQQIDISSAEGEIIQKLLESKISVISVHTNYDNIQKGTNKALASKLGLKDTKILRPKKDCLRKLVTFCPIDYSEKVRLALFQAGGGYIGNYDSCSFNSDGYGTFRAQEGSHPFVGEINQIHKESETRIEMIFPVHLTDVMIQSLLEVHPYEEVAYDIIPLENSYASIGEGVIGNLPKKLAVIEFLEFVKSTLGCKYVRYNQLPDNMMIERVAACGGSGSFLIQEAAKLNADAFISADFKYHDFLNPLTKHLLIIDAGHYETEIGGLNLLKEFLLQKFPNFAVQITCKGVNPVNYL